MYCFKGEFRLVHIRPPLFLSHVYINNSLAALSLNYSGAGAPILASSLNVPPLVVNIKVGGCARYVLGVLSDDRQGKFAMKKLFLYQECYSF